MYCIRPVIWISLFSASCIVANSVSAQQIHRCTANGKTVLSDQPCVDSHTEKNIAISSVSNHGTAPAVTTTSSPVGQNYSTPYGEWRGQAQYQATEMGQLQQGAHTVVNMVVAIDPAGKIVGSSPDNGCKVLGVAAPFVGPNSLSLDVTLSGCKFSGYNRRFSGYLNLNQTQKTVGLTLNGAQIQVGRHTSYDIRATMRR